MLLGQLVQMYKSYIAKTFQVAISSRALKCQQIWFGLHYFCDVLTLNWIHYGQLECALKGPDYLLVKGPTHGVHKQREEVGTAGGRGRLQLQPQTELVAGATRVEAWAVQNHGLIGSLALEVLLKAFHTPREDTTVLLSF